MLEAGPSHMLAALLKRTSEGDRAAFRMLYDRTSAKLFGVISRICDNRELARDVLQETYLTIWRKAVLYDPAIAAPITWMARIARNQAIDARRLRAERISAASEPPDENESAPVLDPEDHAEQNEALRRLIECLKGLPEERRDMVLLAYYKGWSREELAQKFGRPVNTVKTVLRRSLAMLRECLDG